MSFKFHVRRPGSVLVYLSLVAVYVFGLQTALALSPNSNLKLETSKVKLPLDRLRFTFVEAAHKGNDLPRLIVGNNIFEGWHLAFPFTNLRQQAGVRAIARLPGFVS